MPATKEPEARALTVTELNRRVRYLLEDHFPSVLVEGELSNIATPASGHWYFTLKDDQAQLRCAMFRSRNQRVRFRPGEGMQVLIKGKLSIYENRGDYQLIVERMDPLGEGALRQAFEALKNKLLAEGLFDEAHKKPLPALPRRIGVVTSPTGAAIRDILSVLGRRFPAIPVTILPVSVQGENAAGEIIRMIELANRGKGALTDLDVLVVGRGGGSLEDLWSFNDENLARAIFASRLPVVSAVGHEVDFTIADFVADARAATPSAAAELLSPDQQEFRKLFRAYGQQFAALLGSRIDRAGQQLAWLRKRLRHPGRRLQEQAQRMDELENRLIRGFRYQLHRQRSTLRHLTQGLLLNSPRTRAAGYRELNAGLHMRLRRAASRLIHGKRMALSGPANALNNLSPLAVLSRGYAITFNADGGIVTDAEDVKKGDTLRTRLHRGEIISKVSATRKPPSGSGNG